jgi:hypothetical protein
MDWADEDGRAPGARAADEDWRDTRGDPRPPRKGLEERLESWVSRGRDLVDGVSGTRPGSRPPTRGGDRLGPEGRGGLEGVGRWVEGKLDWLLDDGDDWREPWQASERPISGRGVEPPAPRRGRMPLEAISRRGAPPPETSRPAWTPRQPETSASAWTPRPAEPSVSAWSPPPAAPSASARSPQPPEPFPPPAAPSGPSRPAAPEEGRSRPAAAEDDRGGAREDWPEEDTFTVPRWRRQEPAGIRAVDPLASPPPAPAPRRPLPRSTRRR